MGPGGQTVLPDIHAIEATVRAGRVLRMRDGQILAAG